MGYYEGEREWPCPRCGGHVWTLFISVDMLFRQQCGRCGTTEFTPEEEKRLGGNVSAWKPPEHSEATP